MSTISIIACIISIFAIIISITNLIIVIVRYNKSQKEIKEEEIRFEEFMNKREQTLRDIEDSVNHK